MFEQAVFPVVQVKEYSQLSQRIDAALGATRADLFLAAIARKKLRVRQFEQILSKGLLGADAEGLYKQLAQGDQAQIREKYLSGIEKVPAELRQRFLKVYAYY